MLILKLPSSLLLNLLKIEKFRQFYNVQIQFFFALIVYYKKKW